MVAEVLHSLITSIMVAEVLHSLKQGVRILSQGRSNFGSERTLEFWIREDARILDQRGRSNFVKRSWRYHLLFNSKSCLIEEDTFSLEPFLCPFPVSRQEVSTLTHSAPKDSDSVLLLDSDPL
jgi:hypothetical protein